MLLTDDGPAYGDTVTVGDADSGTLYIHEPLKVTGYAGTVSAVKVSENEAVSSSETLMTLSDTADSATYDAVLAERAELEETLQELVALHKEGAVLAPFAGRVESVAYGEEAEDSVSDAAAVESEETLVLSLDPVSYTHLDVYKRQGVGAVFDKAAEGAAQGAAGAAISGYSCLLYTSFF